MLIIGNNHLISQTGWNRCNISLSLSLSRWEVGRSCSWVYTQHAQGHVHMVVNCGADHHVHAREEFAGTRRRVHVRECARVCACREIASLGSSPTGLGLGAGTYRRPCSGIPRTTSPSSWTVSPIIYTSQDVIPNLRVADPGRMGAPSPRPWTVSPTRRTPGPSTQPYLYPIPSRRRRVSPGSSNSVTKINSCSRPITTRTYPVSEPPLT